MEDAKSDQPPLALAELLNGGCAIVFPSQLSNEQADWFRKQDVDMDDWNFMLIVPAERLVDDVRTVRDCCAGKIVTTSVLSVDDLSLYGILNGCWDNCWYRVRFAEGLRGVGVAYHA